MERDKKLEQIIKEHALISAPDNFTDLVIEKIKEPLTSSYKPLIGKAGRIFIFVFITLIIGLSIYTASVETGVPGLNIPDWNFALSDLDWNFALSDIHWKIPSGLLAGLIAVFILALADARLARSRSN